jgi:hypothetical protein
MKDFHQWLTECDSDQPNKDDQGGIVPTNIAKAQKADLITLPLLVEGTNCGNCRFFKMEKGKDYADCIHPKVEQHVNKRMCCKYWDNKDVKRPWVKPS